MRRLITALVLGGLLALAGPAATVPAAVGGATPEQTTATGESPLSVTLDTQRLVAGPGDRIRFRSTVRNIGDRPLEGLIAHLNILTSDPDVYVDPEDWSPRRTQYLGELEPGEEQVLDWDVRAVTSGPLVLYVALTGPTMRTVTASGPLDMTVQGRREVNSANVLPLVAGVPTGVLVLLALTGLRRRRHR